MRSTARTGPTSRACLSTLLHRWFWLHLNSKKVRTMHPSEKLVAKRDTHAPHLIAGIAWLFASACFYTAANIFVLYCDNLDIPYILFLRSLISVFLLFPLVAVNGNSLSAPFRPTFSYSVFTMVATLTWLSALRFTTFAAASAAFSLKAFATILFSRYLLKEQLGRGLLVSNYVSIIGIIIIIRPEFDSMTGIVLAIVAAVISSLSYVQYADALRATGPLAILFYSSIVQTFILSFAPIQAGFILNWQDFAYCCLGAVASVGNLYCVARGYRVALVSQLASAENLRIPVATAGAFLFLSEAFYPVYALGSAILLFGLSLPLFIHWRMNRLPPSRGE